MEELDKALDNERISIKEAILGKFGTISRFCEESGLNRTLLTNFLNGRYDITLRNYLFIKSWLSDH